MPWHKRTSQVYIPGLEGYGVSCRPIEEESNTITQISMGILLGQRGTGVAFYARANNSFTSLFPQFK